MLKRALCLIFAFLFSINSFAAIVSDNDGAAFVTKAEFEALKKNFADQIENYNISIDKKIDGAIASYLSAINLNKKNMVKALYAPSQGIISLGSSDFPWQEGTMDITFSGAIVRYSGTTQKGYFEFSMTTPNPSNFKETLISDVDYTNGTGRFVGYYGTRQYLSSNGNNAKSYAFNQFGLTDVTGYYGGYWAMSNQELTNCGEIISIGFCNDTWQTNYWVTNVLECEGKKASFRRELLTADPNGYWTGGLILNSNSLSHKFNNYDEYRDWCNDTTTDGHTVATSLDNIGVSGSGFHVDISPNGSGGLTKAVVDTTILTSGSITYSSVASALGTQYKPYLGFVSSANNWNKIYTGAFEDKMSVVLPSSDTNYSKNIITDAKGNHLKLGAGLPIVECKYEDKITYEFNFKDKTKNYRVWVKEGSFDSSKNLSDDKNSCITDFKVSGTTTYDSTNKCLVIKNGVGKATWEVEGSKPVIYMKWAIEGNINQGGGILIPSETVEIEGV